MVLERAARYTGSSIDAVLGIVLLAFAVFHVFAGVAFAILPAIGGLALLGAAVAVAPVTRRYVRRNRSDRGDLLVFVGGLAAGCLAMGAFFAVGVVF